MSYFISSKIFCYNLVVATQGVDNSCGENKPQTFFGVASSGELTSPNYPSVYPDDADCQWHINVDFGYVVKLTLLEFDLEDG